jgi:hypothetical protein
MLRPTTAPMISLDTQIAKPCDGHAGKFLQLEATILAEQRRTKTPRKTTKTTVGGSRKEGVGRSRSQRVTSAQSELGEYCHEHCCSPRFMKDESGATAIEYGLIAAGEWADE